MKTKQSNKLSLVFLDLNGTVIDDWDASYAATRATFVHFNRPCPTIGEYIAEVAITGDYHAFYTNRGIDATRDARYEIFLPAYYKHQRDVVVMPGVLSFAETLHRRGVEIHLLTAARRDFAEPLVQSSGVDRYCSAFHYHIHDKAAQMKAVVDGGAIPYEECLMVGDMPSDIRAAKQVGAHGSLIVNQHMTPEVVAEARRIGCIAEAADFHILLTALREKFENLSLK